MNSSNFLSNIILAPVSISSPYICTPTIGITRIGYRQRTVSRRDIIPKGVWHVHLRYSDKTDPDREAALLRSSAASRALLSDETCIRRSRGFRGAGFVFPTVMSGSASY